MRYILIVGLGVLCMALALYSILWVQYQATVGTQNESQIVRQVAFGNAYRGANGEVYIIKQNLCPI